MPDKAQDMVCANTKFRGFFLMDGIGNPRWIEIPAQTLGSLTEWDDASNRYGKVTFFLDSGESASAAIFYGEGISTKSDVVSHRCFSFA